MVLLSKEAKHRLLNYLRAAINESENKYEDLSVYHALLAIRALRGNKDARRESLEREQKSCTRIMWKEG